MGRKTGTSWKMSVREFLTNTFVRGVVEEKRNLVATSDKSKIRDVVQQLKDANLVAIGVYAGEDERNGEYRSVITLADIVHYLMDSENILKAMKSTLGQLLDSQPEKTSHSWQIAPDCSLLDGLKLLSTSGRGIVKLEDSMKMLTPTDILREIWKNKSSLETDEIFSTSFSSLISERGSRSIPSLRLETPRVGPAIVSLIGSGFSSLPVVNELQQLAGTFSVSDFRGLTSAGLLNLRGLSLAHFLSIQQRGTLENIIRPPISCHPSESWSNGVEKMLNERVHGVWVVDEQQSLIDSWTMIDTLSYLARLMNLQK